MPSIGVNIAIIQDDSILLTLREDFEVWCLPGGHLDDGESFTQAAIREAHEETGLDVRLTRFVGGYTRVNWSSGFYHIQLFTAEIIGGAFRPQTGETLDIRFFPLDDLPPNLLLGSRHRIRDAATGLTGVATTELIDWPFPGKKREQVYQMRDDSGLAPAEFYHHHFPDLTSEQIVVDLAGLTAQVVQRRM